ncbi:helix-turn-helix transcriptional regulator [Hyalangium versicolor]|uniref:helix-turn-helix transcriptional regulator n=1 Tax=Hyalangium versicolor TaxID=2861190 RepID=UPI001CCDA640|nr:helix-turn-helix transcriptional regulator [Hyalangium versicolor]
MLSLLTPVLASALCQSVELKEKVARDHQLMEALSHHQTIGSIMVKLPSGEQTRSERATALLEQWFTPQERGPQGLPPELMERLALLDSMDGGGSHEQRTWKKAGGDTSLKVTFVPLPARDGQTLWVLLLEEVQNGVPMPSAWRKRLTPREAEVVEGALCYLDNQDIGQRLGCSEATVKKHLQRAFEKLAVENRNMLLYWAVRR